MKFKHLQLIVSATVVTSMLSSAAAWGKSSEKEEPEKHSSQKTEYRFKQPNTPVKLAPYSTVAFGMSPKNVATMRGDVLASNPSASFTNFKVIPSGVSFGVISVNNKGIPKLEFFSTEEPDQSISKFNAKRYGQPRSLAYTSDARRVLVATDTALVIFSPQKMENLGYIKIPFAPEDIVISGNDYFVALRSGDRVAVYNLEEKKLRRDWKYGVGVNDITFNNGSTEMAVLTNDGVATIYDTRTYNIKTDIDNLGEALSATYNIDGKYLAVATSPQTIEIINLVKPTDRNTVPVETASVSDVIFIPDANDNPVLAYTTEKAIGAKRLQSLQPFMNRLVADEADRLMDEWQKMMPGESMQAYSERVNDESRKRQRRLFEDEISTRLAGDLVSAQTLSLGNYDRTNGVLALSFSEMPTIYLPVPESNISAFQNAGDLILSDVQYGVMPDDSFEIIYAKVFNKVDGKTYEYNNLNRASMDFMGNDANVVSLDILRQQQMEEIKLQQLREKVIEEATTNNVISNHTNITVDSKVMPDYDANGEKILNYVVNFTYQVDPEFSAIEDFRPGMYHVSESGAASSMLKIVKEAFEGDFAKYIQQGKKLKINISGTADAMPINRIIPYDGSYGDFENEPVNENGQLTAVTVTKKGGVRENRQLAFLRAQGVRDFLQKNVENLSNMNTDFIYNVNVSEDKGSEFRRITATFTFVDAL